MFISGFLLLRSPAGLGVKVGAGSERSRVCPPPVSPQPPARAWPGLGSEPCLPVLPVITLGGLGGLSGLPTQSNALTPQKRPHGVSLRVEGEPGLVGLASSATQAFLPVFGSLGSSAASEPRAPKGQKGRIIQASGHPRPLPGVMREALERAGQPPARARPTLAKRGGGGERGERGDRGI